MPCGDSIMRTRRAKHFATVGLLRTHARTQAQKRRRVGSTSNTPAATPPASQVAGGEVPSGTAAAAPGAAADGVDSKPSTSAPAVKVEEADQGAVTIQGRSGEVSLHACPGTSEPTLPSGCACMGGHVAPHGHGHGSQPASSLLLMCVLKSHEPHALPACGTTMCKGTCTSLHARRRML